ncbi:hypothetical protein ANN_13863 [Periplaneta americana]|uniref:Per a allergen n=1 Tax=Periplaneta americana TaxID=6978 RepID=A0ABQ8SUQ5_PERAM|nr:hypothetical protein ANN_13863 [Periplaneta americana]
MAVLAKGGNFAVTPRVLPFEDIIANVESGIRGVSMDKAEEIRRETARILQRAQPSKSNLTRDESRAIKSLNEKEDILILAADKGTQQ